MGYVSACRRFWIVSGLIFVFLKGGDQIWFVPARIEIDFDNGHFVGCELKSSNSAAMPRDTFGFNIFGTNNTRILVKQKKTSKNYRVRGQKKNAWAEMDQGEETETETINTK